MGLCSRIGGWGAGEGGGGGLGALDGGFRGGNGIGGGRGTCWGGGSCVWGQLRTAAKDPLDAQYARGCEHSILHESFLYWHSHVWVVLLF